MTVTIYNSLTQKKEELVGQDGKTIKMYSCGVTVYDKCHIGHARSLYIFDVIRRYLQHRGYQVKFIRNITDVDDKIINKAKELNKRFEDVVEENIALYQKDIKSLGVNFADEEPRATAYIPKMVEAIKELIRKEYAYESDGDVYFSVRSFKDYGQLSGQSVEKMLEAVRIDKAEKKRDPLDFALWKKSKEGEPSWDSPWGQGRPGWHIECSVMNKEILGDQIDIHAGGRDLIFPHHENEIAQSEALTGKKPFARYWIHHGLLTINGQKMAKSLGNFITVEDALKKYTANQLKMLFLSSHYASPVDFSDEKMADMKKSYERISIFMSKLGDLTEDCYAVILKAKKDFKQSMDDDFNTPAALAILFDLIHECNRIMANAPSVKPDFCERSRYLKDKLEAEEFLKQEVPQIFGLNFIEGSSEQLSQEIQALLNERIQARQNKNFKRSDEIRDELKMKGIIVEDGKGAQTWRRA
ncbi:MAG: cysteine--tRNA ligase [Candidatus Omnitrophica bacterium]|nr:cysteine--tRNA ligase [Candidatus Omnitrophota bacterium]